MTTWVKLSESEWAKVPDDWTVDQIHDAVTKSRQFVSSHARTNVESVRDRAIQNRSAQSFGYDVPPGVDLSTPANPGYVDRTMRLWGEASQQMGTPDVSGMNVLNGISNAAAAPLRAAFEQPVRSIAEASGVGGPEAEEVGRRGADLASQVVQAAAPIAVEAAMPKAAPRAAMQVVETDKGPIRIQGDEPALVEDPQTGQTIEQNAPTTPDKQAEINQTVTDPNDVEQTVADVSKNVGITPPESVSVGDSPISSSSVDDAGNSEMSLAEGTPDEVVHEAAHIKAETEGTPQPPEDNNKIADDYLGKRARFLRQSLDRAQGKNVRGPVLPEQPTALEAENFRSGGVEGPKETATASADEAPESLTLPDTEAVKQSQKGVTWQPTPEQPLPQTPPPANRAEAARRNVIMRAADRIGQIWQTMVTAAPKTAGKIGIETSLRAITEAFNQMVRSPITGESALGGFKALGYAAQPGRSVGIMRSLADVVPEASMDKFLMDFPLSEQPLGRVGRALSYLNRQAHLLPKVGTTVARLEETLAGRGLNLWDLANSKNLSAIHPEEVADAMAIGDRIGFSRPSPQWLANISNNPIGRYFAPFGRIMYNRFITNAVDMNPAMVLKVLSPTARAKLAQGDVETARQIVDAVFGTGFVVAGYAAGKHGQYDPETLQGDKTAALVTPSWFSPLYMIGHAIARYEDTAQSENVRSHVMANELQALGKSVAGIPGVGVSLLEGIVDWTRGGSVTENLERIGGQWLSGFTRAASSLHDIVAALSPEEAKTRDTSGDILAGAKKNLPGLSQTLPGYRSPTRSEQPKQNHPLAESVGIPLREPETGVEKELTRLGIRIPGHPTGDAEKDRSYRAAVGPQIEDRASALIASPDYQKADDATKHLRLSKLVYALVDQLEKKQQPIRNKDIQQIRQNQAVK